MRRGLRIVGFALALLALTGCGGASGTRTTVTTRAGLEGDAVARGLVRAAQVAAEAYAVDQNGSYAGLSATQLSRFAPSLLTTAGARLTRVSGNSGSYVLSAESDATGDTFTITRTAADIKRSCSGGPSCAHGSW